MDIQQAKNKIEKIKSDISRKEGEKSAVMSDLKKEFGFKTLDEGYDKFEELEKETKAKQKEKEKLLASVERKLEEYGY